MKKTKIISVVLLIISVLMVSMGIKLQEKAYEINDDLSYSYNEVNINNITASENALVNNSESDLREDNSSIQLLRWKLHQHLLLFHLELKCLMV